MAIIPFPSQEMYYEERYSEFLNRLTAWSTDPRYHRPRTQSRELDFAMLIDFMFGIDRPWQYNQLMARAIYFWQLLLAPNLPPEGRWAFLAYGGPFFQNSV